MTPPPQIAEALAARRAGIVPRWAAVQLDPERLERFAVEGTEGADPRELERRFVAPLLDLLIEHLRTGDPVLGHVYLDERLRYAPHRAAPAERVRFFAEVLPADEEVLAEALPKPDAKVLRERLAALHAPLLEEPSGDVVRLLALGDCLMNELRVFLPPAARAEGIDLDMRGLYFSAVTGRDLAVEETLRFLEAHPMDLVALSFLTYSGLPPYEPLLRGAGRLSSAERTRRADALLGVIHRFLDALRAHTDTPFLLHNASGLPLGRWRRRLPFVPPLSRPQRRLLEHLNAGLAELAAATPNTLLLDEAAVARAEGPRRCDVSLVPERIARGALFHTSRFGSVLAAPYTDILRSWRDLHRAKVLLVDFDNTLWDGVIADGAVRHHADRQRLLRRLREAGMLLVAVSKNDAGNVRWEEMALTPDDFVLSKIGWDLKARSIEAAAQELDLGLDSFVLLDDSPQERELVRKQLPAVRVLDSLDPATWAGLERLLAFPNTRDTEEARKRTEIYRAQAQRREAMSTPIDYGAMMRSLGLGVRFGPARPADLERVSELVQRTNQFNTTTVRYPRQELERLLRSPDHGLYVAELFDKFGSQGLVVVVVVARGEAETVIDSFVMSCRAMGFGLERWVLRRVLEEEQAGRVVGRFVPTDRNGPASGLFPEAGFRPGADGRFSLAAEDPRPEAPDWFRVEERGA